MINGAAKMNVRFETERLLIRDIAKEDL